MLSCRLCILPLALAIGACVPPGGASVAVPDQGSYAVQVPYSELDFSIASPAQAAGGLTATVSAQDLRPQLYYRYSVQSEVNGNYIAMPNPPKIYVIRKLPFYKNDPDAVSIRIDLQSDAANAEVLRTSQAVCSFDLNGKTVMSTPLGATDLLPGHRISAVVQGPGLDKFGSSGTGVMTVWLYGLGADKNQTLHWDLNYSFRQEQRQVTGAVLGQTNSEEEAKGYEDREDPATPAPGGNP